MKPKRAPYMPQSKSDTHITPDEVFDKIEQLWNLTPLEMYDPCPADYPEQGWDGLEVSWKKWNYVNPPYGDGKKDEDGDTLLAKFVRKALDEIRVGHNSIMLLPSKTDQDWFHWLLDRKFEMYFFDHRLKFKNNKWSATQPHFLVMIK